ncbi:hypothetical protein ACFXO2_28000 [Streptomyces sp. NPDC059152]|uniref:hypothetical protein n=1 Tax=Streptomyces sp. NPDC059152 TaxID=3346742 RepID=UPI0036AAFDEB
MTQVTEAGFVDLGTGAQCARLLTDPEMIDACRVRDFSTVFRLVKKQAGIHPSMIARLCDLTPSRVGEVIAGERPAVGGQLHYVVGLLGESSSRPLKNDLCGVAAELARLTGWTHFDARQYNQARAYFTQALQLATEVDDRPFMANVPACMSLQATYQDKSADALAFVQAAQDAARADNGATARVHSMLAMREAFAHASLGSRTATHAALAEAHRQFERIRTDDPDPSWVTYFDEPKLIVDTRIAHGQLGEAAAAEALIADAMRREHGTNQRGRAFHALWLARTQLQLGKLDQACHTATDALASASAVPSERLAGHLKEFYGQLAPYRGEPVTAAFEARLREVLPA